VQSRKWFEPDPNVNLLAWVDVFRDMLTEEKLLERETREANSANVSLEHALAFSIYALVKLYGDALTSDDLKCNVTMSRDNVSVFHFLFEVTQSLSLPVPAPALYDSCHKELWCYVADRMEHFDLWSTEEAMCKQLFGITIQSGIRLIVACLICLYSKVTNELVDDLFIESTQSADSTLLELVTSTTVALVGRIPFPPLDIPCCVRDI
jgi:hypothetical protein